MIKPGVRTITSLCLGTHIVDVEILSQTCRLISPDKNLKLTAVTFAIWSGTLGAMVASSAEIYQLKVRNTFLVM